MTDELKVPKPLSAACVQRKQAVREQVVAETVGTVEVAGGRAGGNIDNAGGFIERHARPAIGGSAVLPRLFWPGLVADLAGMGNGVKRPAQGAVSNVVRPYVARRRWQPFTHPPADDHQILVDHPWSSEAHALRRRIAPEVLAQVDTTLTPEAANGLAGRCIECIDEVTHRGEHPPFVEVSPEHQASIRSSASDAGVERPELRASRGVDR